VSGFQAWDLRYRDICGLSFCRDGHVVSMKVSFMIWPSALFKAHSTAVFVVLPFLEGFRRCARHHGDHVPASRLPAARCGVVADFHRGLGPWATWPCPGGWRMKEKEDSLVVRLPAFGQGLTMMGS
jgi:hypothetical protein